jgi:formate C-acetyltransferase
MEHPEKLSMQLHHPCECYAVKFIDLTREQQEDVIARQAHESM